MTPSNELELIDLFDSATAERELREEIVRGLSASPKWLPCKYLYDQRGSELFDQICELDEYYLTRTELGIMEDHADEMAACCGAECVLVEYGAGSSLKTRLLLDHLEDPLAYVPLDISGDHLLESATTLAAAYPDLHIVPVCADFNTQVDLSLLEEHDGKRVAYFPGSTIGNFMPEEAARFLHRIADMVGPGGGLLIGTDLQKDARLLEQAYNDAAGITGEFILNLLVRMNHEFDADFDLDQFEYEARYNADAGRMEMSVVSLADQTVSVGGRDIRFAAGEKLRAEYSHKYTLEQFRKICQPAGWHEQQIWTDDQNYFAVHYLEAGVRDEG